MIQISRLVLVALALGLCQPPSTVHSQSDTVLVVAGPEYAAGDLKRRLLGDEYRDLWTTPIRVPVLDLEEFAGGLRPSHRGGGHQTLVLHLRNPEGREFVFRSVNKDPDLLDEPAFQNTPVSAVVKDQVSSLQPAAALILPPLLTAVGIAHPQPTLVLMPDDARLGEFRAEFAGVLGWVEERPNEVEIEGSDETLPGFGGYTQIIGTDRLMERLEASPEDRVDAREFLTARLVDILVGDWDRHLDQWRWAPDERDGTTYWLAIPRDRDYAFVHYSGVVLEVARRGIRNVVRFGPRIDDLSGLTLNARDLDRRLLTEPGLGTWDSVVAHLQASLTDSVIAAAVAAMPPEYVDVRGAELEAFLIGRREDLGRAAREYYAGLAQAVEVRGTDEADLALIDRLADDVVQVRLFGRTGDAGEAEGEPYYERTFYAAETDEVRVFLHGGDDHAIVRGQVGRSLTVRVIGGGSDDLLVDSSTVSSRRGRTVFYDARGENRIVRGTHTSVDERAYEAPAAAWAISGETQRDWGSSRSIVPVVDYRGTDGLIIGAGPVQTRYGFRHSPYVSRMGAIARIGLSTLNPALEVFGDFRRQNSPYGGGVVFEASKLENFRFFGFGNDTDRGTDDDLHRISLDRVMLRAYVDRRGLGGSRIAVGPVVSYTNPDVPDGSPIGELPRYGNSGFGQVGGWAEAEIDRRGAGAFPRQGFRVRAAAEAFPEVWTAGGPFGSFSAVGSTYLTPPAGFPVTLALRAGGERALGEFPVPEAAFLGGSGSLRGYPFQRFAGDAAAFGNAELRLPLTEAVLIVRGTLGALGLADAGRVWYDGTSEGDWHTAAGGGLWFEFRIRESFFGASALYAASSEGGRFYLSLGAPF